MKVHCCVDECSRISFNISKPSVVVDVTLLRKGLAIQTNQIRSKKVFQTQNNALSVSSLELLSTVRRFPNVRSSKKEGVNQSERLERE